MESSGGAETDVGETGHRVEPLTDRRTDGRRSTGEPGHSAPNVTIVFVTYRCNAMDLCVFCTGLLVSVLTPLANAAMEIEQAEIVGSQATDSLFCDTTVFFK